MSELQDLVDALKPVVDVLNEIGAPHYVGGSVASSFHGAARSTMDVDLVCELSEDAVPVLVTQLRDRFYVSESAARDAVRRRSCFNLIFYASSFKVDIFVSRGRPFDIASMQRARLITLAIRRASMCPSRPRRTRSSASWNGIN